MDIAAIIAAVVAVAGALVNAIYTKRVDRKIAEEKKAETAAQIAARYRDPLLRASFDLQSRMYNIVKQEFIETYHVDERPDTREYARENTLFVLADYLGWVEILRREVRFLDLGETEQNQLWINSQTTVRKVLQADDFDAVLQVLHGQQRAIGEVMIEPAEDAAGGAARLQTIGYAEFVKRRRDDKDFARWFERLAEDVALLAAEPARHTDRLVALQRALIDLIDCLDPGCARLPKAERGKLPEPKAALESAQKPALEAAPAPAELSPPRARSAPPAPPAA